jgi:hypothetical protein
MKHHFLLDENIFHHAIKGVDRNDRPDLTCTKLVLQIASNCHRIILNGFLRERYRVHLRGLMTHRPGVLQPLFVLNELVLNSLKVVNELDQPPMLPSSCDVPAEDIEVVRAALISHPKFVTSDHKLMAAINRCEALHLRALSPSEAIILAADT